VTSEPQDFDPYRNDPDRWGVSLAQMAEIMLPCLDAAGVRSIAEVGAFAGDLTRVLVAWGAGSGAAVTAIDPSPRPGLEALAREHPELTLIRETSIEALPRIALPDAIVIDGDHNYYTVSEELRLVSERASGADLPLLLFHDVCWPHGRRDDYFAADQIPPDARHPTAGDAGIFPGEAGVRPGGMPYPRSASHEGGPANGVLGEDVPLPAARQTALPAAERAGRANGCWRRASRCWRRSGSRRTPRSRRSPALPAPPHRSRTGTPPSFP